MIVFHSWRRTFLVYHVNQFNNNELYPVPKNSKTTENIFSEYYYETRKLWYFFERKLRKTIIKYWTYLPVKFCFFNFFENLDKFFWQKSKFGLKLIEILDENKNCRPNRNTVKKYLSKIEILVKNKNIYQKSKYSSKIEISVKNRNIR